MEQENKNRKYDFDCMVKMNCAIFSLFEDFCDSQNVEFSYALETAMFEFMNSHK